MTNLKNLTNEQVIAAFQALVGSLRTMMGKADTATVKILCDAIQDVCTEAKVRNVILGAA